MTTWISRLPFITLLTFITLGTSAPPAVADKDDGPLVKPLTELTQELANDLQSDYLFPLQALANTDVTSLALDPATPIDVARVQQHLYALRTAFQPTLVLGGERPVLKIHVDFTQVTHAGTYEISLGISGKTSGKVAESPPKGAELPPTPTAAVLKQQTLTVKLIYPEGQLKIANGTLLIDVNEVWFAAPQIIPEKLSLSELGGVSAVTVKGFSAVEGAAQDERRFNASLSPEVPVSVHAGSTVPVSFRLTGNFPPGTTKASLQLEADQLKVPLLVPYEVRRRLYWGWVPLLFFLSSLLGWFIRTYLKSWQEFSALQVQADELQRRIDRQLQTNPDSVARAELYTASKQLTDNYASAKPQALTAAIQAADAALTKALAQRTTQRQALLVSLGKDLELLKRRATLPAVFVTLGDKIDAVLKEAMQAVIEDELMKAQELTDKAETELKALRIASVTWAAALRPALQQLDALPWAKTNLPAELKTKTNEATGRIAELDETQVGAVETTLPLLYEATALARQLARQLQTSLIVLGDICLEKLGAARVSAEHTKELRDVAVFDVTADPKATVAQLVAAISSLPRVIGLLIKDAYPEVWKSDQRQLEELLNKADFKAAIDLAKSISQPHGEEVASRGSKTATAAGTAKLLPLPHPSEPAPAGAVSLVLAANTPSPLDVRHARSAATLMRATCLRAVGYAILSTVAASLLYGPKFVGTYAEIGALCAFGLSADFTVGTVLEDLLGKMKR